MGGLKSPHFHKPILYLSYMKLRPYQAPRRQPKINDMIYPPGSRQGGNVWIGGILMNVPQPSSGPAVSPTPTPTKTVTPTVTPTSSLTPTPSITPTISLTPTNTGTPTPTPTNPGSTVTFVSGVTLNSTASNYSVSNMPYGGAGLIVIPITSNGNVDIGTVTLGGVSATLVQQYNCSNQDRVAMFQVVMTGGTSGSLDISFAGNSTGLDVCTYRILGVSSNTSTINTTVCANTPTPDYNLPSLPANSVGIYASRNGAADCGTTLGYSGTFGIFQSFKQVSAGAKTCPGVGFGGVVTAIGRTWA
jgi:hypothetical protein